MSVEKKPVSETLNVLCTQEKLAQAIQLVTRVATTKSSLPILANIHLVAKKGTLQLAATDLEVGVMTHVGAKVKGEGTITLPARLLVDFITHNTDDTVTIQAESVDAKLYSERYQATIKGMDAADFPLIPEAGKQHTTTLPASVVKDALTDVAFAAATGDARPVLNGVLMRFAGGQLTLAATDSYRLAERTVPLPSKVSADIQAIIPSRSVAELIRLLPGDETVPVTIALAASQLSLEFEQTRVVSRLVEGTYPDYAQIIPKEPTTIATGRLADIAQAVTMANLFARDVAHHVRLHIDPARGTLDLRAAGGAAGTSAARIPADLSGEPLEIAFNARFLLDALSSMSGDTAVLNFQGADRPVVVTELDRTDYINLVMPLRLDH